MISANAITAWGTNHGWPTREQVEQDLLLYRAICAIAEDDYLSQELVFRGGTALHKLHLDHPYRYSEDLDYVRSSASGIGPLTHWSSSSERVPGLTRRRRALRGGCRRPLAGCRPRDERQRPLHRSTCAARRIRGRQGRVR